MSRILPSIIALFAGILIAIGSSEAQPIAAIDSATCIGCHAQPSRKFHADPTHKKFDCVVCHVEADAHLADTKSKPKLVQDDKLCSSCHALKPRR